MGKKYLTNETNFIKLKKNEKEVLIFDLTFKNCLAQIVVSDVFFAPYKNVSFEAMTIDSDKAIKSGQPELVYFFYDSDDTLLEDVIDELNVGVEYCSKYIPNQLNEMYIGKKGKLNFKNEKRNKTIHPDDLEKVKQSFYNKIFVCTDIQFQYLVIDDNASSIRVLPTVFKTDV